MLLKNTDWLFRQGGLWIMQRTLFFDRLFLMRVISRMHAVVILVSAIGLVVGSAAFATSCS